MNLQGISIKKLFGQFDYDIAFNQDEGITILTGPNGYGKTTILNIVYNLFKQNFFFFQKLNFLSLCFYFPKNIQISLTKKIQMENVQSIQIINGQQRVVGQVRPFADIYLNLQSDNRIIESYIYNLKAENKLIQEITRLYPMQRISQTLLANLNTGTQIEIEDYLVQIPQTTLEIVNGFPKKIDQVSQIILLLSSVDVYLIKEQRLLKSIITPNNVVVNPFNINSVFSHTIQNYANDLRNLISQKQAEAFQVSQQLDSTFPNRLMNANQTLSKDEFNARFQSLTEKQKRLQNFGITVSKLEIPEYNASKSDVLSVYLEDSEKKTAAFDALVTKINLFVSILNEKRLIHKNIKVDAVNGFAFVVDNGQILSLTSLSSGEQEEIVLLYELLFKAKPNALILIDEPEISLHVSWQKTFVSDLLAILKIKQISVLLATHSPQIINGRWDLTQDLYENLNGERTPENE
jgi:predicted ATP-binding protein involved in virulence